jgi:hypothetical protein
VTGSAPVSDLLIAAAYYGLGLGALALLGYLLANSYSLIGSKIDDRFFDLDVLLKFLLGLALVFVFLFTAVGGNEVLEDLLPPRMGLGDLLDQTLARLFAIVLVALFVVFVVAVAAGGLHALFEEHGFKLLFAFPGLVVGPVLVDRFVEKFSLRDFPNVWLEDPAPSFQMPDGRVITPEYDWGGGDIWCLVWVAIPSAWVTLGIGYGLMALIVSLTPSERARRDQRAREGVQREQFVAQARSQGRDLRDPKSDRSGSLRGANLAGCDLRDVDFCVQFDRDMTAADFRGANLFQAAFGRCDLSHADFSGASLSRVNFSGATLRWANFENANMNMAELRGTDLRGADLGGATGRIGQGTSLLYDDGTIWGRVADDGGRYGCPPPQAVHWESEWEKFAGYFEELLRHWTTPRDPEEFLNEHGWSAYLEQIRFPY